MTLSFHADDLPFLENSGVDCIELELTKTKNYGSRTIDMNLKRVKSEEHEPLLKFLKSVGKPLQNQYNKAKVAIDLLKNPIGAKVAKLENLEHALTSLFKDYLVHGFLFKQDVASGQLLPFVPINIKWETPRNEANYWRVTLSYYSMGGNSASSIDFSNSDIRAGASVVDLLMDKGYMLETPELLETYFAQTDEFLKLVNNHGQQYTSKIFTIKDSGRWNSSETIKQVQDIKMVNNIKEFKDFTTPKNITSNFFDGQIMNPVHPFLPIFVLHKHKNGWVHVENATVYKYNPNIKEKLILHPAHEDLIDAIAETYTIEMEDVIEEKSGGTIILGTGPAGIGKCHGKGTKILMFDGTIKKVEDIKVGEKLMGDDSTSRKVVSLANGTENMYKIIPNRGSEPFTINESHILTVKMSGKKYNDELIDISFSDFLNKSKTFKKDAKLVRTSVRFGNSEPEIDPYFVGLWLGDGDWRHPHIYVNTTVDPEINIFLQKYSEQLGLTITEKRNKNSGKDCVLLQLKGSTRGQYHNNRLTKMMDEHGLRTESKLLDIKLITTSLNYRKKILAGYVDADGYKCNNGTYEISSKRKELSEQILFLARSVGYTATMVEKTVTWSGRAKREGEDTQRTYSRIFISGAYDLPSLLPRKLSSTQKIDKNNLVTGFKYENLGMGEYYGFSITGNRRYLLADTTITHNTLTAEVTSEVIERPLYKVNVSLFGTKPEEIEERLQLAFDRANSWNAILLLDEADLYIMERDTNIQHNGIVTVFLKGLEYSKGLTFMTTNKGNNVDEAILSRCTAVIRYTHPDEDSRRRIWGILSNQFNLTLSPELMDKLTTRFTTASGRDIKMLCILVFKYTKAKNIEPTFEVFEKLSVFRGLDEA